jgi:hypothetical protein
VQTQFYYRLTPASHALAGALQSSIHKAVAAAAAASCPAGSGSCKLDGASHSHTLTLTHTLTHSQSPSPVDACVAPSVTTAVRTLLRRDELQPRHTTRSALPSESNLHSCQTIAHSRYTTHVRCGPRTAGETVRIAHSTVDELLADEYYKSDGAYAVYILNPQVRLTASSSSQPLQIGSTSPYHVLCPGEKAVAPR